jgi:hypothetical protein
MTNIVYINPVAGIISVKWALGTSEHVYSAKSGASNVNCGSAATRHLFLFLFLFFGAFGITKSQSAEAFYGCLLVAGFLSTNSLSRRQIGHRSRPQYKWYYWQTWICLDQYRFSANIWPIIQQRVPILKISHTGSEKWMKTLPLSLAQPPSTGNE